MTCLLDTCVISELVAKKPNVFVVRWIDAQEESCLFLSVVTIGEIRKGIDRLPQSERRSTLDEWLARDLTARFAGRILAIDEAVMLRWGSLVASLELAGRSMSALDSLIAATALAHDLTLVTRNESDFVDSRVPILNPWR